MNGIMLSKEDSLEALKLYEKINRLLADDRQYLNTGVFACALTNCLSDLIAQLHYMHGKDLEALLNDVMEDIKRPISKKLKHIEKIMSEAQSTNET